MPRDSTADVKGVLGSRSGGPRLDHRHLRHGIVFRVQCIQMAARQCCGCAEDRVVDINTVGRVPLSIHLARDINDLLE